MNMSTMKGLIPLLDEYINIEGLISLLDEYINTERSDFSTRWIYQHWKVWFLY